MVADLLIRYLDSHGDNGQKREENFFKIKKCTKVKKRQIYTVRETKTFQIDFAKNESRFEGFFIRGESEFFNFFLKI